MKADLCDECRADGFLYNLTETDDDRTLCDDCLVDEDADLCDECRADEETFSTPCGSMTSDEIQGHILDCQICAAEHADFPLDL